MKRVQKWILHFYKTENGHFEDGKSEGLHTGIV